MKIKTVHCKYCDAQMASIDRVCPYCGCKNMKLLDRWWVWVLIFFIVAGIIMGLAIKFPYSAPKPDTASVSAKSINGNSNNKAQTSDNKVIENIKTIDTTQDVTEHNSNSKYGDGEYVVGKDIEAGSYSVRVIDTEKNGSIEKYDSSTNKLLSHTEFTEGGHFKIHPTDSLIKLNGVELTVDSKNDAKSNNTVLGAGTYKIGTDIKAGTYKIESTGTGKAYYARLNSLSENEPSIIHYQYFKNFVTIKVLSTDVALHIENAKLIPLD